MKELNIDIGVNTYSVNGKSETAFNPTDSNFVAGLFDAFTELDKKQDAYREEIASLSDKREIFRIARERDAEMRQILDNALGAGTCERVFGSMSTYALADGLPVWVNLMLAIIDEVDTSFAAEQKKTNPRLAKYTAKYDKYRQ